MSTSARRVSFGRLLVDLNTQCDFLLPRGSLPVANRATVLPNVRRIMNWARVEGIPIISTLESHRSDVPVDGLPPHCIDRSRGQRKLPFTLMPARIVLCGDNTLDVPLEPFRRYQQVIFTKRDRDFLSNPKADRMVATIQAGYLAVFGVLAERCVKTAALGLLARRQRIIVVRDACGYWSSADAELAFRQMEAKGTVVATTEELLSGKAAARLRTEYRPFIVEEEDDAAQGVAAHSGNGNGNGNGKNDRKPIVHVFPPVDAQHNGDAAHHDKWPNALAHLLEIRQHKNAVVRNVHPYTRPGKS